MRFITLLIFLNISLNTIKAQLPTILIGATQQKVLDTYNPIFNAKIDTDGTIRHTTENEDFLLVHKFKDGICYAGIISIWDQATIFDYYTQFNSIGTSNGKNSWLGTINNRIVKITLAGDLDQVPNMFIIKLKE